MRFLILLIVLIPTVAAGEWRQFRGETGGQITQIEHPLKWGSEKNVAWSVPMVGSGWSSPVIVDDRVFLTAAVAEGGSRPKGMMAGVASMRTYRNAKPQEHEFIVRCLSLSDGAEIWSRSVATMTPPVVHPSNTYATESPATDGQRVFTFFATTGSLTAWSLEGELLWRRELGSFKTGNGFGTASSLAVSNDRVFVQFDNEENSFVASFNSDNGEEVWRAKRKSGTSWATPLIWRSGAQEQLVTCGSGIVTAYNPDDGEVIWRVDGVESSFSASPAIDDERVYFGNSGPMSAGPLVAVPSNSRGEIRLNGDFEAQDVAWSRTRSGPGMASPVVSGGRLFIPGSGGILNCYDAASGERIYRTRVPNMGTVAASLWADDQHVFILDENGSTYVIESAPEFRLSATNSIDDLFWSTPAVAGDTLLLRGVERLYCIRP